MAKSILYNLILLVGGQTLLDLLDILPPAIIQSHSYLWANFISKPLKTFLAAYEAEY